MAARGNIIIVDPLNRPEGANIMITLERVNMQGLIKWVAECLSHCDKASRIPVVLIGSFIALEDDKEEMLGRPSITCQVHNSKGPAPVGETIWLVPPVHVQYNGDMYEWEHFIETYG